MPTLEELEAVARGASPRPFDASDRERIGAARAVVEAALESGTAVYGVTTGFGRLENVRIATSDAAQLQVNLLRSHAVGSGPALPEEVVRGMLLLLASSLRRGHSGVRVELVELVLRLLDRGVTPVIPSKGSVGSSGDLAPLAHLGLVLIGEGEATYDGAALPGGEALARAGLAPVALSAKEGLAIINGTHLMAAAGGLAVRDARRLLDAAIVAVALSLEAFKGSTVPFDARLHELRRQPRGRQPRRLRPRPGPVHAALRAAGARRGVRRPRLREHRDRARARRRDRQPARGRRRHPQRRQLPRPAALAAARPPRARAVRAGVLLGAPHLRPALARLRRPAGVPDAPPRALVRADDRPVRRRRARQRVPGPLPPGGRRLDPYERRPGGLQLDGRARGVEGADRGRERRPGHRHRARVCRAGPRVPPAAGEHAGPRGRRRARARVRAARRGGPLAGGGAGPPGPRAPPRGAGPVGWRGWVQEAALRMLENNLHPDVAERPEDLVVYGGDGKGGGKPAPPDADQ